MISIENVTKKLSNKIIIDDLSIKIEKPIIYGLLGPNGAGKTTTIRLLCGIITPTKGDVVFEKSIYANQKKAIGYMPEETGLYRDMSMLDEILYFGKLHGLDKKGTLQIAEPLINNFELNKELNKSIGVLSKGTCRKVQFICTLLHSPNLLILDEPFSGLDPLSSNIMENEIIRLNQTGKTIILSTHRMEQVETFCNHVFILNHGKKIMDNNLESIKNSYKKNNYEMNFNQKLPEKYNQIAQLKEVKNNSYVYNIAINKDSSIDFFLKEVLKENYTFTHFEQETPKLKQLFLELTSNKN
jgi:ABC-2 type transport system ATP-binding protein